MSENKKILIVEDDQATLESLRIKFAHANIDAVQAETGRQALDILDSVPQFDLVLLDLMLPLGDGFWLLEEKRKNPNFEKIPVIVISNLNQAEHVLHARELGASGYLVKANHSISEIANIVGECLRGEPCTFDNLGA